MSRRLYQLVILATIACVLVVLIAPTADLPVTALRAMQYAAYVMLCITLAFVMLLLAMDLILGSREKERPAGRATPSLHPLLCTFLC